MDITMWTLDHDGQPVSLHASIADATGAATARGVAVADVVPAPDPDRPGWYIVQRTGPVQHLEQSLSRTPPT